MKRDATQMRDTAKDARIQATVFMFKMKNKKKKNRTATSLKQKPEMKKKEKRFAYFISV